MAFDYRQDCYNLYVIPSQRSYVTYSIFNVMKGSF